MPAEPQSSSWSPPTTVGSGIGDRDDLRRPELAEIHAYDLVRLRIASRRRARVPRRPNRRSPAARSGATGIEEGFETGPRELVVRPDPAKVRPAVGVGRDHAGGPAVAAEVGVDCVGARVDHRDVGGGSVEGGEAKRGSREQTGNVRCCSWRAPGLEGDTHEVAPPAGPNFTAGSACGYIGRHAAREPVVESPANDQNGSPSAAQLHVRMLGSLAFEAEGEPLRCASRKALLVAACAILERARIPRARLARRDLGRRQPAPRAGGTPRRRSPSFPRRDPRIARGAAQFDRRRRGGAHLGGRRGVRRVAPSTEMDERLAALSLDTGVSSRRRKQCGARAGRLVAAATRAAARGGARCLYRGRP